MNRRRLRFAGWGLAAGLLLLPAMAACGGDDDEPREATAPGASPTAPGVPGTAVVESAMAQKVNDALVPEAMADGKRLGKAEAALKIEAYEDFGCPHCLEFTAEIEPVIFQEYVATGKASFEYKYFPLRQQTGAAAIAAQCAAEQDKFWEYHRALFIAQAEANAKTGPPLAEAFAAANLRKLAQDLGLDVPAWDTCVTGDSAVAVVQEELRQANTLALPGTPSFVINGKVTPAPDSVDGWRKLLDGLLK